MVEEILHNMDRMFDLGPNAGLGVFDPIDQFPVPDLPNARDAYSVRSLLPWDLCRRFRIGKGTTAKSQALERTRPGYARRGLF